MQVIVDSLLIDYQINGSSKKAVLLLHGWGDNRKTFGMFEKDLSKKYKVISMDLPGFGASQTPNTSWDLDDYSRFVKDFLKKIQIYNLYAIIGHSNGGAMAIYGIGSGIISADKLVLLAASGIRNQQKSKHLALKVIAKTGKAVTFWLPNDKKQKLQNKLYRNIGSDMLVTPHMQETFKKTVRQDVQKQAIQINIPTLLVYGEKDKDTPPIYGEIYHDLIKDSKIEIISNSGHFVHHEQAQKVTKVIEEFLF